MNEIDFFNSDGSINFRNMDDTRRSFETNFSKKYLGSVMKNLVANCVFDKNVKEGLKNNEGLKLYLNNAVNQIAENAFDERDSNRNTFTGAMTETVEKYSSMEGNYRYEKALFVANGKESKEYKNKKINTIFSAENFLSDEIEKQFKDEFSFKHGYEAEELVIEVGKEIGEMIAEAETKQVIMEQTMSAIADEKENIRKELGVDDEKDEETETSEDGDGDGEMPEEGGDEGDGDIEENGDSTDDSNENIDDESEDEDDTESEELGDSSDDDEPGTEDEDQSEGEESYSYGLEGFSKKDQKRAVEIILKNKDSYINKAKEIILKCSKNAEKIIKTDKDVAKMITKDYTKSTDKYIEYVVEAFNKIFDYIGKGKIFKNRNVLSKFPIFDLVGDSYSKVLTSKLLSNTPLSDMNNLLPKDEKSVETGFKLLESKELVKFMSPYFDKGNNTITVGFAFDLSLKKILEEGLEDYDEIGLEKLFLNENDREEAIDIIQKNRSKYMSELRTIINGINTNMNKIDSSFEKRHGVKVEDLIKKNYVEDKDYVDKKIKLLESALDYIIEKKTFTGNAKRKIIVPLMVLTYERKSTYILRLLTIMFVSWFAGAIWDLISSQVDKNRLKYQEGVDTVTKEMNLPFMKAYVRQSSASSRDFITVEIGILFNFSLKKILKHGGMEDYEGIHNIEKQLLNRYMDNLSSYYEDVDLSEIEENIYSDMTSDENGETLIKLPNGVVSKEEYIKKIYSAENISNVLVPLSPVKLDNMEIPSLDAMSAIFTRATEDINSIRSIMGARLEMLGNIVSKESDEELSGKFENLKSVALESIERADVIRDTISRFRITPFGLESDDREDILIARNLYNFVNDKYKLSSITPKKFDSMEDAINAAFDIGMIKKSYLDTESLEDYNEIQERENRFWESMVKMDLDNDRKTQIENILKLQDLDLGGGFIVNPAFEKSLKLATKANPLKVSPTKSENEINDMIFDRVVERMKNIELVDDIDQQSKELIRSLIDGTDPVGYLNTPFEKLLIDEGKNNSNDMEGDFELSAESKDAYNRAFLGVTIHSFVNRIKPFSEETLKRFNKYMIPERI